MAYKRSDHTHNWGKHNGRAKPRIARLKPLLHELTAINNKRRTKP